MSKYLLDEGAKLNIFDPKVEEKQALFELSNSQLNLPYDLVKANTQFFNKNILEACEKSHAIVVCTEWDMFKTLDYEEIYKVMLKPAYIFDGRLILEHEKLEKIGFNVVAIGKSFHEPCSKWIFINLTFFMQSTVWNNKFNMLISIHTFI